MSTPDFELHRAIVHWSDPTTGFAQVRVPTLLGAESVVYIPNTGLTQGDDGFWNVPPDGASVFIAVSSDRTQFLWLTAVDAAPVDEDTGADILAATGEPMGHEDRTESAMAFDDSTRIFTIQPVGDSFTIWCKGTKYVKTGTSSLTLPDSTGLYYIYFDPDGLIQYRTGFFVWDEDCPTSYVYWNATTQKAEFFADERHGIVLDWQTHEYLHRTRGAAIANGFDLDPTKFIIDGDGSLDGDCYWGMYGTGSTVGTFFDEDLQVDIINSATPTANTWEQFLEAPAEIPVFYKESYGWVKNTATNFPFKSGPNRPYYNSIGDFSYLTEIDTNKFGIAWIVATNNLNDPVLAIMGQDQYGNIGEAEAADWSELDLTDLPIVEMRPLYKYVFQTKDTYTNSVKAALRGLYDIRRSEVAVQISPTVSVDHGGLLGLADDDHPQYYNEARLAAELSDITDALSYLETRLRINSAYTVSLGADFLGASTGATLGSSVALSSDGYRFAVASQGTNSQAGSVSVYQYSTNPSSWTQLGSTIVGEAAGDYSGISIALSDSGTILAIGGYFNDGAGTDAGHVRVYQYSGLSWSQLGSDIDGEAAGDNSGISVSLSSDGSILAIGAPNNDGTASNAGHTRVYEWSGSAWVQLGSDIDGEEVFDNSGRSVSLSSDGTRVAIGAIFSWDGGENSGHTRVFDWNGSSWVQVGADIAGEAAEDLSGISVSLSADGNRVAIGAYLNDGRATNAGHVRVYDWNGTAWTQVGADVEGIFADDTLGFSVALSSDGNRLVAGGPFATYAGDGRIMLFEWSGTSWVYITSLSGPTGAKAGYSVAMSRDGKVFASGAPEYDSLRGYASVRQILTYADHV